MNLEFRTNIDFEDNLDLENWPSPNAANRVKSTGGLTIVYLNIRSIRSNWDAFLLQIKHAISNLDIIILAEVSCSQSEVNFYHIDGFTSLYSLRENKKGGGIILYYKTCRLLCAQIDIQTNAFENVTCFLEPIGNMTSAPVCVHAVYRPPSSSTKIPISDANIELYATLESLKAYKELVVIGDTNINTEDYGDLSAQYEATLAAWGLERGIWGFTREEIKAGRLSQTCIDHIYLKSRAVNIQTGVVKTKISDHYLIALKLHWKSNTLKLNQKETVDGPKYVDERKLRRKLKEINWNEIDMRSTNSGFNEFVERIQYSYEECTEVKAPKSFDQDRNDSGRRKTPIREWMDFSLTQMVNERDRLFKKWKRTPKSINYRNQYKRYRNIINQTIKTKKERYYKALFEENKRNPKELWNNLNYLMGRKRKANIDEFITNGLGRKMNITEVLDGFADFFVEGIENIKHPCPYQREKRERLESLDVDRIGNVNGLHIPQANTDAIRTLINQMKVNKAPGEDGIRMIHMKECFNEGAGLVKLTELINISLREGQFPDILKTSLVRPIYKGKNRNLFENYRPIAILPSIDKIMEKYVLNHFNKYLEENQILSVKQFGFRTGKSTEDALELFSSQINSFLDNKKHTLILFIDMSKAFDTIEHKEILRSLKNIGVGGSALNWFKSYLENRKFKVKIQSKYSVTKDVSYGVPQGSQLGPILFIIYLDSIIKNITECEIFAFADDLAIVSGNTSLLISEEKLQSEFVKFCTLAHDKGLIVNQNKTVLMHISTKNLKKERDPVIKFHDCECINTRRFQNTDCNCTVIKLVEKTKYLGIVVDNRFSWKEQCNEVQRKLNTCMGVFFRIKGKVGNALKITIYKALVESILRYGIEVWGNTAKSNLEKINKIQFRCLHALGILDPIVNTEDIIYSYRVLGVLTPKGLYTQKKITRYKNEERLKIKVEKVCNTRSTVKYKIPYVNTLFGRRLPEYEIPKMFNSLPNEIENLNDIKVFKRQVYKWLIEKETFI